MNRLLQPRSLGLLALPLLLYGAACSAPPYQRVDATACQVRGGVMSPPALTTQRVLRAASLQKPVEMHPAGDGTKRVFIVGQPGLIYLASDLSEGGGAEPWLDLRDRVESGPNEAGLLGLAFDPAFRTSGRFYVSYTRTRAGQLQSVISRFTVSGPPLGRPDPATEVELLSIAQPYSNHNGGSIAFGPDGLLYLGFGDGGSAGDPQNNGQRLDTLLGKILRIDVSGPGPYRTPADNPFVGQPGAREEIWAYGLRNPWRFAFDPATGALWAGDVGQGAQEEIDIIEKGGNYGWRRVEGTACYSPAADCQRPDLLPPVAAYDHGEGKSVSGGQVYRGAAMPSLYGSYIFGDFVSGTVWGLTPGLDGVWQRSTLLEGAGAIAAFGLDGDGELYVLDWAAGQILKLTQADPAALSAPGWPARLSDTGCFADLLNRTLPAGALRYAVNVQLWSDGADKERGLVLPAGSLIGFTAEGAWELPVGTLASKSFLLGGRPVETRLLLREAAGWRGATYRWNDAGTDADLLSGAVTAPIGGQTWYFPSRADCLACHTRAAGQVLGLSTSQLNRTNDLFADGAAGGVVEQIDALRQRGYFVTAPAQAAALPRFPAPSDTGASVATRARAYLAANCAHCHSPGGLANATIDLRARTELRATAACDVPPQQGDLGVAGARIIAPGEPQRSTLYLRMATTDPTTRMPNLATRLVDPEGTELVRRWIAELGGCAQ